VKANRRVATPKSPGHQPKGPTSPKLPKNHAKGSVTTAASNHLRSLRVPRNLSSEIDAYNFLAQLDEQNRQEAKQALEQNLGPITTSDLQPTIFKTSDIVVQSTDSFGPSDPRSNPQQAQAPGQTGGFLPPPPS
jgi:hypothetical protein